jgi:hypothetical protein
VIALGGMKGIVLLAILPVVVSSTDVYPTASVMAGMLEANLIVIVNISP